MLSFKNIDELLQYMFRKQNNGTMVSVVADQELTIEIMKELFTYDGVMLDLCEIDSYEYDKEYLITLYEKEGTDFCHVSIEQMFDYESGKYYGTDGYLLLHEDANSKAQIDVTENKFCDICGYDWFKLGEDDGTDHNPEVNYQTDEENSMHGFTISKTDENGCFSYSFHTSETLDEREILEILRTIGF